MALKNKMFLVISKNLGQRPKNIIFPKSVEILMQHVPNMCSWMMNNKIALKIQRAISS